MRAYKYTLLSLLIIGGMFLALNAPRPSGVAAQQPTGAIPTVTGTPSGPVVSVDPSLEQINVYAGPSSYNYPAIGVLLTGVEVPALGRAREDEDWIVIRYEGVPGSTGWVYAPYVSLRGGSLPLVDSPPTPTPASTPTLNPTLVAALLPAGTALRLPTYTPPPPLAIPTFVDQTRHPGRVPVGLLIFGFLFMGVLGTMISFLRGR